MQAKSARTSPPDVFGKPLINLPVRRLAPDRGGHRPKRARGAGSSDERASI
jgi:hypothetical protein